MNFLSLDHLLLKTRSGSGLGIIVEDAMPGSNEQVYSKWFGHLSHLITFFPPGSYPKAEDAIYALKQGHCTLPLAGIADRAFATELEIRSQFKPDYPKHVYRTDRYAVENYLLDPKAWFEIAKLFWHDTLPKGYQSIKECEDTINDIFRLFLPAAAYNWMVSDIFNLYGPKYILEFKDRWDLDPENLYLNLLVFCRNNGLPDPSEYHLRLELLRNEQKLWHQKVDGNIVFSYLTEHFPVPGKRPERHLFINYYVSKADAPSELFRLVEFLIGKYLGKGHFEQLVT